MKQMEKRLRRLERKNNFLLSAFLLLMTLFLLSAFSPQEENNIIQCQRLEILDANGNLITFLGVDKDGSRGLFINDEQSRVRVATIHDANQSAFYAFDTSGTVRIGLAQFAHGGGGLALHGENSKGASVLYHKEAGTLSFYDLEGKVNFRLPEKK